MAILYLPYEYTSVLIDTGNTDPFGIDPEQTTLIDAGNINPFAIDPDQTTVIDTDSDPSAPLEQRLSSPRT